MACKFAGFGVFAIVEELAKMDGEVVKVREGIIYFGVRHLGASVVEENMHK